MSTRKVPNKDELTALYLGKKLSSNDIAKMYGVSRVNVCRMLKKMGITRPLTGPGNRNKNRFTKNGSEHFTVNIHLHPA